MHLLHLTLSVLLLVFSTPLVRATPPGSESAPQETAEVEASLFIVGASIRDGHLKGVEVVWVPESLRAVCAGKTLRRVHELVHLRTYPAPGEPVVPSPPKGEIPRFVLTTWLSADYNKGSQKPMLAQLEKNAAIQALIKEALSQKKPGVTKDLAAEPEVRARLHWELWGNGENFRVLELR
jgi:hypothetical protein